MDLSGWVESEPSSGRGTIIRIYCIRKSIFNFKKYKNVEYTQNRILDICKEKRNDETWR